MPLHPKKPVTYQPECPIDDRKRQPEVQGDDILRHGRMVGGKIHLGGNGGTCGGRRPKDEDMPVPPLKCGREV